MPPTEVPGHVDKILVSGSERGVITFAACCRPIPGDEIMGYLSSGKGVVVHRLECRNVAEFRKTPERWVAIDWDRQVEGDYRAALRIDATGYGELKRMFVAPAARGLGLGRRLLDRIERQARWEGLDCLRLETGIHQPEALELYRSAGYTPREPFGDYAPDPLSVFMEKRL